MFPADRSLYEPLLVRFVALAGVAVLATLASRAHASPEDVLGFGARSMALGATGPGSAEGYEAVYGNPALLSAATDRELTLGFVGAHFDLRGRDRISYEPLTTSVIGATLPVPFGGVLRDRIVLGLGFYAPFGLVVRGRILYPETPQFLLADRTQSVAVQAGAGILLGHGIRIGGGFAALAALDGSVLVSTDASGRIGTVVEDTLVASYGPIAGATLDVSDAYRIGVVFRGELVGRFNVVIDVKDLGQIVVPPLNISGTAQYDPWQIGAEVARVKGPWRAAVGLTFKHWSAYPGPAEATVRCPSPDEAPDAPEQCQALVPREADYHDTVSPHAGIEREIALSPEATARLRGGGFFEMSPAPAQQGEDNLYDNHRLALTLGYGLRLAGSLPPLDLDLFGQIHWLLPRDHEKSASVPATNPGAGTVTSSGVVVAGGMTVGARF